MKISKPKKAVAMLISIIFVLAGFASAYATEDEADAMNEWQAYVDATFGEGFFENQNRALEIAELFFNSLGQNARGETVYPDFYAGTYIDENGNLVILITESSMSTSARSHTALAPFYDEVIFRPARYSYAELRKVADMISSIASDRQSFCPHADNMSHVMVNHMRNRVIVGLFDVSDEMVEGFRGLILDSPMIEFEHQPFMRERPPFHSFRENDVQPQYPGRGCECDFVYCALDYCVFCVEDFGQCSNQEAQQEAVTLSWPIMLNPGTRLRRMAGAIIPTDAGSVGYRAHNALGRQGVVVAAHSWPGANVRAYINNLVFQQTFIGFTRSPWLITSTMDAVFIETDLFVIPTNDLPNGLTLSTNVATSFITNQVVFMVGPTSGGMLQTLMPA